MGGPIVVGIDGSDTSQLAAEWGAREAHVRGSALHLVSAWDMPTFGFSFSAAAASEDLLKAVRRGAEESLAEALERARATAKDIEITTEAVVGGAAGVLIDASRRAELLVVGSRGLGGFRDLLLGSVSEQCANHAACPVVIVRHLSAAA